MKIEGISSFFYYRSSPSPKKTKKTNIRSGHYLNKTLTRRLIGELKDLRKTYKKNNESNFSSYTSRFGYVLGFFGLDHPWQVKNNAARKLIRLLKKKSATLKRQELSALRSRDLGKIISKPVYQEIITKALKKDVKAAIKDARDEITSCIL